MCACACSFPPLENSVSGSAYRPGDVIPSRKGLKMEIGNTDAEGRLVLADALTEADNETPELLIDIATLTGAARAATGFELPPFFTDDEKLAGDLVQRVAFAVHDPLWRLPLVARLRKRDRQPDRRSQQQPRLQSRRRHHRGAVPQPLCRQGQVLGASRHPGLDRSSRNPAAAKAPNNRRARFMRC